jgi:hypothetical protein
MKIIPSILLIGMFLNLSPSYGEKGLPDFSQYKVKETDQFKGKPKSVDLSSYEGAKTYRTKLREGAHAGPNFAGHYTVVTYGCGTQCQDNWVIDAQTGKIIDRFESVIGSQYQLGSALLIVNGPDAQVKKAYEEHPEQPILGTMDTTYKVLKDGKFQVVHKVKWADL